MDGRDERYWLKGTITMLEARVEGLQYELHTREIRLKEQEQRIAELEQQVEELKKQAVVGKKRVTRKKEGHYWLCRKVPAKSRRSA